MMTEYWCRFFDWRGNLCAAERLRAAGDDEAIAQARAIFAQRVANDFEVRHGNRVVLRETLGHMIG